MTNMKSLSESLFDSKTQTMESLFDKDLVSKVSHKSLLEILKGKVTSITTSTELPLHKLFDANTIKVWYSKYRDDILPTKRYLSKYRREMSMLNGFICHVLNNVYVTRDTKYNFGWDETSEMINKDSKTPLRVGFYMQTNNNGILAYIMYINAEDLGKQCSIRIEVDLSKEEYNLSFISESLFDSKTQTMESLFDKDLTTKMTPVMLKHGFINEIKSLYDKYGIKYEVYLNHGARETESIILSRDMNLDKPNGGLGRVFDFDVNGKPFKYYVYFRPEFVVPVDNYVDDKSLWYMYSPDLWFVIKKEDGSNPPTRMQYRYNKFAKIESLSHDDKPGYLFSDKEAIKDCLDKLETSIFVFNSDSFKIRIDKLIDKYCNDGKFIPLQEIKRLADKL